MGNEALFRDKPVWTAVFTLAVPSVLAILMMVIRNMAAMFFIGMLGNDYQVLRRGRYLVWLPLLRRCWVPAAAL